MRCGGLTNERVIVGGDGRELMGGLHFVIVNIFVREQVLVVGISLWD